jgi:D-3-phosphoglycerate dehydrogenase
MESQLSVMVIDTFSQDAIKEMESAGMKVYYNNALAKVEEINPALAEHKPHILVVRSTKVPKEVIDSEGACNLKMIMRAGAGYDTIDFKHAAGKGIAVCKCPGMNSKAVADLAMGFVLSVDRRMAVGDHLLKEGKWNKKQFSTCKGIPG